jgi:carbonic anhydrase
MEVSLSKEIIAQILKNNENFVAGHDENYFKLHSTSQQPKITLVSCCDSRVQPGIIEPDPINKVFTVETIGNQMTSAQGSVDYGVLHLHTPVLLIMGHTDCGAVKAFMKGYEKENDAIKKELDNMKPSLKAPAADADFNSELIGNITKNLDYQISVAVDRYSKLIEDGTLSVIGSIYDFQNAFDKGYGRLLIRSINGKTDLKREDMLACGVDLKDSVV